MYSLAFSGQYVKKESREGVRSSGSSDGDAEFVKVVVNRKNLCFPSMWTDENMHRGLASYIRLP